MTVHTSQPAGSKDPASAASSPPALELINISKRFGAVQANKKISLSVPAGTIQGIVGENGAGKSTLMSIIYGFYEADEGQIKVDGKVCTIRSSQDAIRAGIGMVHQHFMLVDNFSVIENVMLGAEGGALLRQGREHVRNELLRLGREYNLEVDPDAIVGELSVGLQQRVEILKALYRGARILILDEPTGVLTPQETDELFRILFSLREQGVTVILITHKLREIIDATTQVAVMRAGEMVAHRLTVQTSKEELAELMVGRKVLLQVNKADAQAGQVLMEVSHLCVNDAQGVRRVKDVSFLLRAGEVVGIAGVSGNGQSELLEAMSGILPVGSGTITLGGASISAESPKDPAQLRELGLAHVPEDRHRMGVVTAFSAKESAILGHHHYPEFNGKVLMNQEAILSSYKEKAETYDIRPRDPHLKSANFSGGNQQKIVLAREMEHDPAVLLIGQPTRGVDIGAIEFIHQRIIAMRDAGKAILLVSVELEEIMSVSDRILVMCDGQITGEVNASEANERTLGLLMANAQQEEVSA
ncbi:heme ABC transporter ATP-binding protein [Pokkaliibacter plantistimulans]|uniref:Heme ABC transporter ATP-binding protein n=1 Tax=Proteobacteria bacterium 228 TaxID=2083153 RepID=A0A2S5KRJ9_9PROT|nr:ABC transporter ATP-binding protein [Pokkaliibacter plantistimulans]PPC77292.1 heme ABC transporter ATP-binding protein [Pokkaliibacter plantistimulans]